MIIAERLQQSTPVQNVILRGLKMSQIVVSLKIMPGSPEIKLDNIESKVKEIIIKNVGEGEMKTETVPVAFGLNSLNIIFVMSEDNKLDPIEDSIKNVEGVNSVEVIDVRRAIG